jgi:hypothetical protein
MKTFNAISGQTLADVCMNTYGSMDYFYKLLQDNRIANANAIPYTGQPFVWDETLVVDAMINKTNVIGNVKYATGYGSNGNTLAVIVGGAPSPAYIPTPQPPAPAGGSVYQIMGTYDYVSASTGGETIISLSALAGKTIQGIEADIQPLLKTEWSWVSSTGTLTLTNPIYSGSRLFIIYTEMINA